MKILDLDSILGTTWNRVERVGLELEGAWKTLPPGIAELKKDTSVFKAEGNKIPGHYVGELASGPILPAAVPNYLKKYYPTMVDKSCGMHAHMSFETMRFYTLLMVEEYPETLIEYLTRWAKAEDFPPKHHIWSRLAGDSIYCQKKFWPDLQTSYKEKDWNQNRVGCRYTQVHYCGRLGTVEVRVLPMMNTPEQALRAINMVIDVTNAFLLKVGGKRDQRVVGKLELPNGFVYEEFYEEEVPLTSTQRKGLKS